MVELIRGPIRVEFEDIGEGYSGEYDPSDPQDIPLLRFTVSQRVNGEWQQVDDASYCTLTEADTDKAALTRLVEYIMDEIYNRVVAGTSIKRTCERLSWISPDWIKEGIVCSHEDQYVNDCSQFVCRDCGKELGR